MLRRLRVFLVSGISVLSIPVVATAQEATDAPTSDDAAEPEAAESSKKDTTPTDPPPSATAPSPKPDVTSTESGSSDDTRTSKTEAEAKEPLDSWQIEVHGYFRAPMALGFSSRPNPDTPNGPANGQISYAPNRVVDGSYYSFAYTRLQ